MLLVFVYIPMALVLYPQYIRRVENMRREIMRIYGSSQHILETKSNKIISIGFYLTQLHTQPKSLQMIITI